MYNVEISDFKGPLDLLLHMIEESKIDIYDIPIIELTDQYIDHIESMEFLDLDVTSDFVIMTSTLLHIKSKMLLPKKENEKEDPREDLVFQLLEYKKFKEVSKTIEELTLKDKKRYYKKKEDITFYDKEDLNLSNLELEKLKKCFEKLLFNFYKDKKFEEVEFIIKDEYPVNDSIYYIKDILSIKKYMKFEELFSSNIVLSQVVSLFLGVLELVKSRDILIFLKKEDIYLQSIGD